MRHDGRRVVPQSAMGPLAAIAERRARSISARRVPSADDEHASDIGRPPERGSCDGADDVAAGAARIGRRATTLGVTRGVAASLTGGLVVQPLAAAEGASDWLRGGVVADARSVEHGVLVVDANEVVSARGVVAKAAPARRVRGADVDHFDGQPSRICEHARLAELGALEQLLAGGGRPAPTLERLGA